MVLSMATALATLMSLPAAALARHASPIDRLERLERALGPDSPAILIKRDDLLAFGQGGNKVRKIQMLAADVQSRGADTVITCGAVQSNHARVTAAAGAVLGWRVVLVLSGQKPAVATGNLKLDEIYGADVRFVASREDRERAMADAAAEASAAGRRPYVIPVGASTPLGAMGMARAISEVSAAGVKPTAIVHASSSAGTQAGLTAGCALFGLRARVIGVSADEPADALAEKVGSLIDGMAASLGGRPESLRGSWPITVDDTQVGEGYAIDTPASREATTLLARTEGIIVDPVYTAKAMAGLIAHVRSGAFGRDDTVLFWHTGGSRE
jgi:1-aminocyclopropane-1-carboxylate deaminase/D-cysteine desulfhydrase-like pyridoxal-dependent ACC family enzyme